MTLSSKIKVCHLHKSYASQKVVKDVSLEISQGEIIGLLGPNGAGKTTSFYMIVGLVSPDSGDIFLNDHNITKLPLYKRALKKIGYLPQEPSIFRNLSVEDNILAVLENRKIQKTKKKFILKNLIDDFQLEAIKDTRGSQLSGGERRRVEIARTLALEPHFIFLDEPFAGIDPLVISDIQKIIFSLKKRNIGILITDHNVKEILEIVDRAYIMNEGKLLVSGTSEEIIQNESVRKIYLGKKFKI